MSRAPRVPDARIAEMRQKRKQGALLKELAYEFGLSMNYVCRVINFRDRKNVKVSA